MVEEYNKLVRDKIPEIIKRRGGYPVIHVATNEEYLDKLNQKLLEEAFEYKKSGKVEELVDLMEVIYAICELKGISKERLIEFQRKKAEEKGKFLEKIILERVE